MLKPTTSHIEISKICREAVEYGFAAVCVPPPFVTLALQELGGRGGVKVATVIGFPFGYSMASAKLAEVEQALADGADELDVVINLIALKAGDWGLLEKEMRLLTTPLLAMVPRVCALKPVASSLKCWISRSGSVVR